MLQKKREKRNGVFWDTPDWMRLPWQQRRWNVKAVHADHIYNEDMNTDSRYTVQICATKEAKQGVDGALCHLPLGL